MVGGADVNVETEGEVFGENEEETVGRAREEGRMGGKGRGGSRE